MHMMPGYGCIYHLYICVYTDFFTSTAIMMAKIFDVLTYDVYSVINQLYLWH